VQTFSPILSGALYRTEHQRTLPVVKYFGLYASIAQRLSCPHAQCSFSFLPSCSDSFLRTPDVEEACLRTSVAFSNALLFSAAIAAVAALFAHL
jgi:hypothetical protein